LQKFKRKQQEKINTNSKFGKVLSISQDKKDLSINETAPKKAFTQ